MRSARRERLETVRARAGYACEYCRIPEYLAGGRLTEDHCVPTNVGGVDTMENVCLCCWWCNIYKGARTHAIDPHYITQGGCRRESDGAQGGLG